MRPSSIQQGDRIYMLLGGSLSLVLRPCGESSDKMFKLVREYYTHFIMHGEAFQWLEKGHLKGLVPFRDNMLMGFVR
jgi:virulence-associated protein VagC